MKQRPPFVYIQVEIGSTAVVVDLEIDGDEGRHKVPAKVGPISLSVCPLLLSKQKPDKGIFIRHARMCI